jgi:hypothetical protein
MTTSNIPELPGYITYVVTMGDKVSIGMKPIDKPKPLMTLVNGIWMNKITRSFYKLDSDGARWVHIAKKNTDLEGYTPGTYVPDNHLASLKDIKKRREARKKDR